MKNLGKTAIFVCALLSLAACASAPQTAIAPPTNTAAPTSPPTATIDPCGADSVKAAVAKLHEAERKFVDDAATAGNTARIGLAPVLMDMQKIRRETEDLAVPVCVVDVKEKLMESMDFNIDGYAKFAAQDDTADATLTLAAKAYGEYLQLQRKIATRPSPTP
jgi:hypothetical protein